jgi:hypothetical protein
MNSELQQQTDLILKALETLHSDNQHMAIIALTMCFFLGLLIGITIIKR